MDQPHPLDGASMGWPWALPFIGILLSIAIVPLLFPKIWHTHYGKIALGWGVLALAPLAILHRVPAALAAFVHAMLAGYIVSSVFSSHFIPSPAAF